MAIQQGKNLPDIPTQQFLEIFDIARKSSLGYITCSKAVKIVKKSRKRTESWFYASYK